MSWLWMRHLLPDCALFNPAFETDILHALAFNARYIERYLSTYFSPNTHLLGEAAALFFIGMLCPELTSAAHWRDCGWRILLAEAQLQIRPDGVHFEQSLYYHVYALDFFLHARLLAARNDFNIPAEFDIVLQKMLGVVSALSQTGPTDGFGDDDGGRVFNPRRNRSEHLADPLALGAVLFGRHDFNSARLTEESIWLFGKSAVSNLKQENSSAQELSSVAFESAGIYVMASSEGYGAQLTIDAGPQGTANSGHGHADALAVRVSVHGGKWLVDAGTAGYVDETRDLFRGTGAHNTLRVDGLDQAVPAGPFAWTSIPKVHADIWIPGETFALFAGHHSGYSRLPDPVRHRRLVFHLHGGFWLVRDVVEGGEFHDLETFWHFAPELTVTKSENVFMAVRSQVAGESPMRLGLLPVECSGWSAELCSGYVSSAYGRKDSAAIARCSARAQLPAEHAMLLHAVSVSNRFGKFTHESALNNSATAYRYDESGKSHFMIFANLDKETWTCRGWTSDARFLYCCFDEGRLTHFILCEGSFAHSENNPLLAHNRKMEWFEWQIREGLPRIFSSDDRAQNSWSCNEKEWSY
jgi:hypothetical protein